ncbi:Glycosyl transferase family 2 [Tranquillimonas rosea]|uniref:Glycosyl transferase family 2 n=1 Tax=Tranquillimonas rosea TaxID=641238 RepID=A0A1H9WZ96_9RHOB|nr:glycosyltransferase family 2 protein [Tranquillimonas rosea]SES39278.1 Glycosyl transferase family 2 [Tranquillimonas rosea]
MSPPAAPEAARPRVVLTVVVRDEADIIADMLHWHLRHGVSHVIAMDNGSGDGTREILGDFAAMGCLTCLDQPDETYRQDLWMSQMAAMARDRFGADWVIPSDADEFWTPPAGTDLPGALAGWDDDVDMVRCPRRNLLASWEDLAALDWPEALIWRAADPGRLPPERLDDDTPLADPFLYYGLPPKVALRPGRLRQIARGAHQAEFSEGGRAVDGDVTVFHAPFRRADEVAASTRRIAAAVERDPTAGPKVSTKYRRWARFADEDASGDPGGGWDRVLQEILPTPERLLADWRASLLVPETRLRDGVVAAREGAAARRALAGAGGRVTAAATPGGPPTPLLVLGGRAEDRAAVAARLRAVGARTPQPRPETPAPELLSALFATHAAPGADGWPDETLDAEIARILARFSERGHGLVLAGTEETGPLAAWDRLAAAERVAAAVILLIDPPWDRLEAAGPEADAAAEAWLAGIEALERDTRGRPRMLLPAERLLSAPAGALRDALARLGVWIPAAVAEEAGPAAPPADDPARRAAALARLGTPELRRRVEETWAGLMAESWAVAAPAPHAAAPAPEEAAPAAARDVHAVVIGWDGMHERALRIARELAPVVARLTVIYSNESGTPETGPGDWIGVPQSWFFGPKFAEAVRGHGTEDVMLQIQADAQHEDWGALARHVGRVWAETPALGVWAPSIDWTPYAAEWAVRDHVPGTMLYRVAQTDGIVWALARPVVERFAALDYDDNNLGWGLDWAAAALAAACGLEVVRDTAVSVHHPKGRGYSSQEASRQMRRFLSQLTSEERRLIAARESLIETRQEPVRITILSEERPGLGRWRALRESAPAPLPANLPVSETLLREGRLWVRCAPEAAEGLCAGRGGLSVPLVPDPDGPAIGQAPVPLPLAPSSAGAVRFDTRGFEAWRVAGLETGRLIVEDPAAAETSRCPVTEGVTVPAAEGELELSVALAAHRAEARLVLEEAGPDGAAGEPVDTVAFDRTFTGGQALDGYQVVRFRIPAAGRDRTLRLVADRFHRPEGVAGGKSVLFVTAPLLLKPSALPDLVWPARRRAPGAETAEHAWHSTAAGALSGTGPPRVELEWDGGRQTLVDLAGLGAEVELLQDSVLRLRAQREDRLAVWIDALPAFQVTVGPMPRTVPLSERARKTALAGRIELRDLTGTFVLWSGQFSGLP